MNTESANLHRVPNPLPAGFEVKPGDFFWDEERDGRRALYICLPGDTNMYALHVQRGAPGGNRVWGWDGNEDQPTITPSIHWLEHWHGYLTAGRLISC